MDEATAKTKWCPFSRIIDTDGDGWTPTYNRIGVGDGGAPYDGDSCCIGSACMAWRRHWYDATRDKAGREVDPAHDGGYCGIAGKPT